MAASSSELYQESKKSRSNHQDSGQRKVALSTRLVSVQALVPMSSRVPSAVERLEADPRFRELSTQDRSFARLIVTTAERRMGQLDAVIYQCESSKKKPAKRKRMNLVDQWVQAVLRVGAVQLLFLGVPPHAAVKETVDVLRRVSCVDVPEAKIKFVNAVLRRLSREGKDLLDKHTSLKDNAASWLVKEWKDAWGEQATQTILQAAMVETPRCLSVRRNHPSDSEDCFQRQLEVVAALFPSAEILPTGSVRVLSVPRGPVSSWPAYSDGSWWLQDVSATLPATALHQELKQQGPIHDMTVVDLCSAPGGKTAQLANYGFGRVIAVEQSARRCRRLKENMDRLRLTDCVEVVVADGTEWIPDSQERGVSGVLLDAPCTATGTASKRPDVLRKNQNFKDLLDLQYRLACHALDEILQPGGILVYATCSLLKQESEDQIKRLLERNEGAIVETIPFLLGEIPGIDQSIDKNGNLRMIPGHEGSLGQCDGFFVAKLRRVD